MDATPDAIAFEWFRDTASVGTGPTYSLTGADVGTSITVRATATKAGYATQVLSSAALLIAGPAAPQPPPSVLPTAPDTPPPAPSSDGADGSPLAPPVLPPTPPIAGGTIPVTYASGTFLPFEWVYFVFYSTPAFSASVQASATGSLSASIPVPPTLAGGTHTLAATGASSGIVSTAAVSVTALAVTGANGEQWWTVGTIASTMLLLGAALLSTAVARRREGRGANAR